MSSILRRHSKKAEFVENRKARYTMSWLIGSLLVATLLAGSLSLNAEAAEQAKPANDLERLEFNFFHHAYPKESKDKRIERLEKVVFGEAKEGSLSERMKTLLELVPITEEAPEEQPAQAASGSQSNKPAPRPDRSTSYPAVTAIEKNILGHDYEDEPVEKRLARLEKRVFGHQSDSDDLSVRMDALKRKTRIDVARKAPPGTEWAGEDDVDIDYPAPSPPASRRYHTLNPKPGEDGRTFSGRDLRKDFQKAFGNRYPLSRAPITGGGSYGMMGSGSSGSSGSGASGSYGFGGKSYSSSGSYGAGRSSTGMPPRAPSRRFSTSSPRRAASGVGINQKVLALEKEIFGKTYEGDSLGERVKRIEKTVFPNRRDLANRPLPQRIDKILSVIPLSPSSLISQNSGQSQDYSSRTPAYSSRTPNALPSTTQRKKGGGLSRILSSLGNFIAGSSGFSVGGYPMAGGLITDPRTGLLVDQTTGNLIDPHTGMVVGRRSVSGYNNITPGFGYRSFNNGFSSPYISPRMGGSYYGIGGSGFGFGTGLGGFSGGMWP